jgi:hypothetical protein
MPAMRWASPFGPFATAAGAAFTTFTANQDVSPAPVPTIGANQLEVGTIIEAEAEGEFSTTATPTLQIGFYFGTVAVMLAQSSAITTGTATAWPWHAKYRGKVVAVGTSGSIVGQGYLDLGTALTTFASATPMPITAAARTVAIDTTVNKALGVSAAWSASSASNSIKVNLLTVLALN